MLAKNCIWPKIPAKNCRSLNEAVAMLIFIETFFRNASHVQICMLNVSIRQITNIRGYWGIHSLIPKNKKIKISLLLCIRYYCNEMYLYCSSHLNNVIYLYTNYKIFCFSISFLNSAALTAACLVGLVGMCCSGFNSSSILLIISSICACGMS